MDLADSGSNTSLRAQQTYIYGNVVHDPGFTKQNKKIVQNKCVVLAHRFRHIYRTE